MVMESFNLKQYIIQHLKDKDPKELTTQNINKYIRAAKAFQSGVESNEVELDDDMKSFISSMDLLSEGDITKIVERLKGYFRLSGDGDVLRVGPNNRFVRFDRPENARAYQSMFRRSGSSLQVNVEKLQEELSGGVMTEKLMAFYDALVKVLPIKINIKPDRRILFLANFIGVAAKTLTDRELPSTTEGGEANISRFMVVWPRMKTRITNAIPLGRIPRRRVLDNLYRILNDYDLGIEIFTDIFMEEEFVQNELDVPVSEAPNSKTYAEWIVLAILSKHPPTIFSTRERKVVNSLDIDMEFDYTTGFPDEEKMDLGELNTKERRRIKTYLQDAEPTKFFGEEYLKLTKVINTLGSIVDSAEEDELEGMDEENLKLIKKLAHLRKRYETLYEEIYGMVYGEEE